MNTGTFPVERIDEILKRPQDFRLLERIPLTVEGMMNKLPIRLQEPQEGDIIKHAVILDTETTGMNAASDRIIELGLLRCSYSFNRRVLLSIDRYYDEFEDPGRAIPLEVQELTGISDEMVRGHKFDDEICAQMLSDRPLVIAHNARFDRPFFDRRFPLMTNLGWACSLSGINWDAIGSSGKKLEYLNQSRGWFYDAHRAYVDCLALVWLLHLEPEAFDMLIETALACQYRLNAWQSPFRIKDDLKAQGFSFDGLHKVWYKNFSKAEDAQNTLVGLSMLFDTSACEIVKMNAANRYK